MSLGWLLAVVLGGFLFAARQDLRLLRARLSAEQTEKGTRVAQQRALTASFGLATLRLQLKRMREAGELEESEYQVLIDQIDACFVSDLEGTPAEPDGELWWSSCETAWNTLTARGSISPGPPPWQKEAPALEPVPAPGPQPGAEPGVETPVEAPATEASSTTETDRGAQGAPETEPDLGTAPALIVPREAKPTEPEPRGPATATPEVPAKPVEPTAPARAYAWRPTVPGLPV